MVKRKGQTVRLDTANTTLVIRMDTAEYLYYGKRLGSGFEFGNDPGSPALPPHLCSRQAHRILRQPEIHDNRLSFSPHLLPCRNIPHSRSLQHIPPRRQAQLIPSLRIRTRSHTRIRHTHRRKPYATTCPVRHPSRNRHCLLPRRNKRQPQEKPQSCPKNKFFHTFQRSRLQSSKALIPLRYGRSSDSLRQRMPSRSQTNSGRSLSAGSNGAHSNGLVPDSHRIPFFIACRECRHTKPIPPQK